MNKFFLYARKSTDEPDRQILSIDAQITELKEYAKREGLNIVRTFIESQTAKEPGRTVFNEMLDLMEAGKADGIISWHPDRLARNSVDGGRVIHLIDREKICALKFPTFWFDNTPQGKFMLNIAFGQSKYYIDNLSENVKRGLRQKVRNGEKPGLAPIGYLNDRNKHTIVPDPERFDFVKEMFELYATGEYSLKALQKTMYDKRLHSKSNKAYSFSVIQRILQTPFYYGLFCFKGELYQGVHEPAISKKLFDSVQVIMKDKSRPKKRKHNFLFRGLLSCAECGCAITAETQKGHHYYRCTKKKQKCTQGYVREEILAKEISSILSSVSLPEPVADAFLQKLDKEETDTRTLTASHSHTLRSEMAECEGKLNRLLDSHLESIITKEEYTKKKAEILNRKVGLEQELATLDAKGFRWLEPMREFILEAKQAQKVALDKNYEELSNFLKTVGSNAQVRERKVVVKFKKQWKILTKMPAVAGTELVDLEKIETVSKLAPKKSFSMLCLASNQFINMLRS